MKKTIFITLLVMSLGVQSCFGDNENKNAAREALKNEITATNKMLSGRNVDIATVYEKAEFFNDEIHYYYIINEEYIDIQLIRDSRKERETALKEMWETNPALKVTTGYIKTISGKVFYHYKGCITGKEAIIIVEF